MLEGCEGEATFARILSGAERLPEERGVYAVVMPRGFSVAFMPLSAGGRFKGKDATLPISRLQAEWVDDAAILYFGKAGATGQKATLQKRVQAYAKFGSGQAAAHYGGRLIWQLENSMELKVQWKRTFEEPRTVEKRLISDFIDEYGKLPFANLRR